MSGCVDVFAIYPLSNIQLADPRKLPAPLTFVYRTMASRKLRKDRLFALVFRFPAGADCVRS
jgi:hypothetical protein